ncbi:MAG: hypothetical protein E6G57_09650 [Actinobacteria bacterium]|nr:MAG: hypothetical protein E6G57_09650 [Actinomycetota bacterium]
MPRSAFSPFWAWVSAAARLSSWPTAAARTPSMRRRLARRAARSWRATRMSSMACWSWPAASWAYCLRTGRSDPLLDVSAVSRLAEPPCT